MSLRVMLIFTVLATVIAIVCLGAVTDYGREEAEHTQGVIYSLQEQAGTLQAAYTRMPAADFLQFAREACKATELPISPGHHIYLLGPGGQIVFRSHPHQHPYVEAAVLQLRAPHAIVSLPDGHNLGLVQMRNDDGTTIVTVEYMDQAEEMVWDQLLSRAITTMAISLAIVGLLTIGVKRWVLLPIRKISHTLKAWESGDLSRRAPLLGSRDMRQLAAEFNVMAGRLETYANELNRSNEALQQFAYVASHDLKEPLLVVTMHLHLLETSAGNRLDAESREYMQRAAEGARHMQAMINDLLEYARVETRSGQPEPIDSGGSLRQAMDNLAARFEETGAHVTHEAMPEVLANEGQLARVFQNLIGNAIKFRGEQIPEVHVAARREGSCWIFSVRDNGIGIDPREAARMFQIFQRGKAATGTAGTGIGLAVCRRIIEHHGGRIWVESSPGHGSTFFFTLPVAECGAEMPCFAGH